MIGHQSVRENITSFGHSAAQLRLEIDTLTTVLSPIFNSSCQLTSKSVSSEWSLDHHHAVLEPIQIAMEHFPPRQCSLIKR